VTRVHHGDLARRWDPLVPVLAQHVDAEHRDAQRVVVVSEMIMMLALGSSTAVMS
jgi:hypothetical protein